MDNGTSDDEHESLTRRALPSVTASISGAAIVPGISSARGEPASIAAKAKRGQLQKVTLTIDDGRHQLALVPMSTLADALRDTFGLTGTKNRCNHGQCGACTVHVNGQRVLACLTLAATCEAGRRETVAFRKIAIQPDAIGRAITQSADVNTTEIVVRPVGNPA